MFGLIYTIDNHSCFNIMEEYIPKEVGSLVQCYVINKDTLLKEKEGVDITICCSDGRVVELYHKNVVEFCNISFLKASNIRTFYAYDPFIKYYIIQENSEIVVLKKRENCLKTFSRFSNVQKYEISDFLKLGKPQIKIWLSDELEPVVTDFSDTLNCNGDQETELSLNLNHRLNVMKLCLKEINDVCENKKLCSVKTLSKFKNSVKSCIINFEKSWQKVVDDFWIVSMFVENTSEHLVTDLYLLNEDMQIETKILQISDDEHQQFEIFNCVRFLSCHSTAYVVGIINIPVPNLKFTQVISKSFSLLYNVEKANSSDFEEIKLLFELDMVELVNGNLGLFYNNEVLIEDIITSMVVNEEIVLKLHFKEDINSKLDKILIENLNFLKIEIDGIKPICFIVAPQVSSHISRFLLFIKPLSHASYLFRCFVKNTKHSSLFVNVLGNFLPILSVCQKKSFKNEVPFLAAVNKLDDEFKHFSSLMKCGALSLPLPLQTESKLQFTAAMWKELIESRLQFDTDLKFQDALLCNSS